MHRYRNLMHHHNDAHTISSLHALAERRALFYMTIESLAATKQLEVTANTSLEAAATSEELEAAATSEELEAAATNEELEAAATSEEIEAVVESSLGVDGDEDGDSDDEFF